MATPKSSKAKKKKWHLKAKDRKSYQAGKATPTVAAARGNGTQHKWSTSPPTLKDLEPGKLDDQSGAPHQIRLSSEATPKVFQSSSRLNSKNQLTIQLMRPPSPPIEEITSPTSPPYIQEAQSLIYRLHARVIMTQSHIDQTADRIDQATTALSSLAHDEPHSKVQRALESVKCLESIQALCLDHWMETWTLERAFRDVVDEDGQREVEQQTEDVRGELEELVTVYTNGMEELMAKYLLVSGRRSVSDGSCHL